MTSRKRLTLGGVVLALVALAGCATASTEPDMVDVHYTGGTLQKKKFVDCLPQSTRSGYDPGDQYYGYPTRQISYEASDDKGAEHPGAFTVVSADNAEMRVPATVTFRLKTDCKTLRQFHENVQSRFGRAFDASASSSDYKQAWLDMLNFVIGKPFDTALDRASQGYKWRQLWNDPTTKTDVEKDVSEKLAVLVKRQAGGDYFDNFSVLLQTPTPTNTELTNAVAEEQAAVAKANSEAAKADAQKAQATADAAKANAQVAVAKAEAAKKKAEIEGYGGPENFLKHECITNGSSAGVCNPWQPTYILPGGAGK